MGILVWLHCGLLDSLRVRWLLEAASNVGEHLVVKIVLVHPVATSWLIPALRHGGRSNGAARPTCRLRTERTANDVRISLSLPFWARAISVAAPELHLITHCLVDF